MHYRVLGKTLGLTFLLLGATMVFSLPWAFGDWANESRGFFAILISMLICCGGGWGLFHSCRKEKRPLLRKEAIAVVGLGWLGCGALGALPFILSGALGPVDALFESISGFTTTGATVFGGGGNAAIEEVPDTILFWRSFTHWLGGMGILVLFIAVLPFLGAGGKQMFKTEAPGLNLEGLKPRIRETASTLWKLYIGLSVAETLLLLAGMDLFDSLTHTFGTMATGGFSPRNASVGAYDSVYIDTVITVFMIFAGTNFSLYWLFLRGQWKNVFRDSEWRVYVSLIAIATLYIMTMLWVHGRFDSIWESFRYSVFQVVAIITTTGYATAEFNDWPDGCRALLVTLMFVGGMAGSTGGGMKVIRHLILFKAARYSVRHVFSPHQIKALRINSRVLQDSIIAQVLAFGALWLGLTAFGALIMSAMSPDLITAFTSVAATLNNIGPGLEAVQGSANYAFFPWPGKLLLSLFMVLGRLELYAILVLFVPAFWRR